MPELHHRTCNLCEAMCGLVITTDGGKITDIRGDKEDVFSRGHICPKGPAMRELQEDPDRKRRPMRRLASGEWEKTSWEAAFELSASRIKDIQREHGRDAVGIYIGNPTVHNHGATIMLQAFTRALGSKNRFDANSMDANPKLLSCLLMYGDPTAIPIPDVDRTEYMLILGANPAASNGSLMTLGDVRGRMQAIRERGGKIVLVDPRRTETAAWASEHHFIRPGGDAPLLLAILHVLFADDLIARARAAELATGLSDLEAVCRPFPPERVAARLGMHAGAIRQIARDFARAPRAVAYGRVGTCLNDFGTVASWLIDAINVVTGNFDRAGGAMFTTPAVDLSSLARRFGVNRYARWRSRVRGLPELAGQLPTPTLAEEIETPGKGQIRGLVTVAGNPVLSSPNGERLAAALDKLDFMVSVDFYVNETSRHAHLILPPVYALERGHFDLIFHALAVRNTVKYSPPVFPKLPDEREDWEILYELGMRLGGMRIGAPPLDAALKAAWRVGVRLTPDTMVDLLMRSGRYGDKFMPFSSGLNLAKVKKAPHGIDLGALQEGRRSEKVQHKAGKVALAPRILVEDVKRIDGWLADGASDRLVLIGRRHVRSNNSWMHNVHSLTKGPDRAELFVNPTDGARLGVADGQTVKAKSRVGAVTARVKLTDEVMPGVVSLPHGFGHARAKDTLRIAGALSAPSINDLTDEQRVEGLSGTAVLNGTPISIEPT